MEAVSGFPASCQATARGLQLRAGLRFDDWRRAGAQIARISSASTWWLGDWVVYGEQSYGSRYKSALEVTALDYQTLRNYAWVARRFEASRRRDTLSFQHHAEVAGLAHAQQELWLGRAERQHWSRNELRRRVAADRSRGQTTAGTHALVLRMDVATARQQRWRAAATAVDQDLRDWIATAADHAAEDALAVPTEPAVRERSRPGEPLRLAR